MNTFSSTARFVLVIMCGFFLLKTTFIAAQEPAEPSSPSPFTAEDVNFSLPKNRCCPMILEISVSQDLASFNDAGTMEVKWNEPPKNDIQRLTKKISLEKGDTTDAEGNAIKTKKHIIELKVANTFSSSWEGELLLELEGHETDTIPVKITVKEAAPVSVFSDNFTLQGVTLAFVAQTQLTGSGLPYRVVVRNGDGSKKECFEFSSLELTADNIGDFQKLLREAVEKLRGELAASCFSEEAKESLKTWVSEASKAAEPVQSTVQPERSNEEVDSEETEAAETNETAPANTAETIAEHLKTLQDCALLDADTKALVEQVLAQLKDKDDEAHKAWKAALDAAGTIALNTDSREELDALASAWLIRFFGATKVDNAGAVVGELTTTDFVDIHIQLHDSVYQNKVKSHNKELRWKLKQDSTLSRGGKRTRRKDGKWLANHSFISKHRDSFKGRVLELKLEFEDDQLLSANAIIRVPGSRVGKPDKDSVDVQFLTRVPLSYSRRKDVSMDYKEHQLREYRYALHAVNSEVPMECKYMFIHLSDILTNRYDLHNGTENYAPKDTCITLKPFMEPVLLRKPEKREILSAKLFTDLVGFGQENPNGLVQTEVARRFWLNARTSYMFGRRSYDHWGVVNSVRPKVLLAKLEEDQLYLPVDTFSVNGEVNLRATGLDLYRYARLESGAELNLIYGRFNSMHFNVFVNVGGFVRVTDVQVARTDSTQLSSDIPELDDAGSFAVKSVWFYPEIAIDVRPYDWLRIGLTARLMHLFSEVPSMTLDRRSPGRNDFEAFLDPGRASVISFKFEAAAKLGKDYQSSMFFRSYCNYTQGQPGVDWFQVQVGVIRPLFGNAKK